jgi:hypothetical protein
MNQRLGIALVFTIASVSAAVVRADEKDPVTIIDKAMKALGGEDKLKKIKSTSTKTSGKVIINGQDNPFTVTALHDGHNRVRTEFQGEFNGNEMKVVSIMNGDKGWAKINDQVMEFDEDRLANEKRNLSIQMLPTLLYPLKGETFKLASVPEQKVKGSPALGIKVTATNGKDFTIFFDKESGLPVKSVADVVGWNGEEVNQETYYSEFKDYSGIKKASKVATMRNGEPFIEGELLEFKVLDKVPPDAFAEPK